ncbi:hypothetical protein [Bacteroides sp. An19]|uniref:hypothetical protein n=1 Tax=Bacteroides sp. An19 TaxID=1965580 RepID=UPI000B37D594|nr:hypothetical protein [Bacteroides sp. An19]OUP37270.1 hypothetical protein B5F25_00290 [Bacteroides sp. An19]
MASIIADLSDDIKKMKSLKEEIQQVKKELGSINVKVELDIKRDMEARLKALTGQYDALVQKVAQAEAKIAESTSRINKSAETIIKAQEQITKSASGQADSSVQGASGGNSAATNAQTASVQAQAKAYDELANEIDDVMGTRAQNIKRMVEEQNAIRIINEELKRMQKLNQSGVYSASETRRIEQLNASLMQHKTALSELRQSLNNSFKLDSAAATSMNALSQSLARMRMTYRELTEEERNSPFGQELLASIQQADAKIKQLDASIGNHQRNVGNYASGWNGLNMSIQQIGRELPSLAMGWNTFFLAISNNLPILTDEIKRAKDEYNALKAAGQQATPVWKQVVSSLLSWQTALTVGITLLTMYGSEIIDWVGNLFKAKDGTAELEEATKRLNTSVSGVYGNISEEMRSLKQLSESLNEAKRGTEEWNQVRNKIVTEYSKYLPSIDKEIDKTGTLAESYDRLAESIRKAAAARGFEELKNKENEKYAEMLVDNYQKVYERLIDVYGQESGQKIFENWKNWAESSREIPAEVQKAFSSVSIGFSDTANSLLFEIRNQQKAREQTLDRFKEIFDLNEDSSELLPSDSIKALRDRISAQREALEKLSVSSKEYKDLLASIQKDEQKLSILTSSPKDINKSTQSIKDYLDELTKLREDNEDRQVELMEDGTEKQIAEIKLRYKRMRDEVRSLEQELTKSQGGKLTKDQEATFSMAYTTIDMREWKDISKTGNTEDRIRKEKEAMNRYLQEYGTFQQKRLAITEEYNQKIQKALSENNMGEALAFTQERNRLLSSLDKEKAFEGIEKAFGNISNLSGKAIDSLIDNLKKYKKEAIDTFDVSDIDRYEKALSRLEDAKLENKFSVFSNFIPDFYREQIKLEEEFNQAQETSIELGQKQAELEKEILEYIEKQTGKKFKKEDLYSTEGINGIAGLLSGKGGDSLSKFTEMKSSLDSVSAASDNAGQKMSALFNMKGGSGGGASTVAVIDTIVHGINDLVQGLNDMANEIKDTMEALGRNTDIDSGIGKFAEGMSMFAEASQGATDAWDSLKSGNIGGVFAGVTKSFTAWIKGFAGIHDKKNEKRIQQLQEQVDTLTDSYDKLGRAVEDAYSKDASGLIEDQNKLLEQQKLLIEQQIREEQDKKNTDDERIKEWQRQIEEINQTIEDNKEAAVDAIFGEDLQSAIENFADAYAEAWANGEDKAESAKDTVKKMMQQMVTESIKAAMQSSGAMEEIRNKLQQFYADNVLTGWEQDYIYNMAEELQKELDSQFGWADSLFGNDEAKKQQSASSRGFGTEMTHEDAGELSGRFTALNESSLRQESIQQGISNIADDMRNIIAQSYLELQQISENTSEIIKPIKQMQLDIAEVKRNTSRI